MALEAGDGQPGARVSSAGVPSRDERAALEGAGARWTSRHGCCPSRARKKTKEARRGVPFSSSPLVEIRTRKGMRRWGVAGGQEEKGKRRRRTMLTQRGRGALAAYRIGCCSAAWARHLAPPPEAGGRRGSPSWLGGGGGRRVARMGYPSSSGCYGGACNILDMLGVLP